MSQDPSLPEALAGPERDSWRDSLFKEIRQLCETGTLAFVDRRRQNLVTAKWVLRRKLRSSGELEKLKSRLVARGFTQRFGVDFNETTSTTARAASWRILLALATIKGWRIAQIDFVGAFLLGDLEEEIFMAQFPLLEEFFQSHPGLGRDLGYSPEKIIWLRKPLYGLKQSGAMWQKKARQLLSQQGMTPLRTDDAVYHHHSEDLIAVSHVDDFLIIGPDNRVRELIDSLRAQVELTEPERPEWFLGVRLRRAEGKLRIDQQLYAERALAALGMSDCRSLSTPVEKGSLASAKMGGDLDDEGTLQDVERYSHILGKLMYAACISRPDIQFAVSLWSRFASNPSAAHAGGLKRVLRYLRGAADLGIEYSAGPHLQGGELGLYGVADASFASDVEGAKSTSGVVFFMAGGPVCWSSRQQSVVAQNTTESEYYAMNEAAREAAWIRGFLSELGVISEEATMPILNDNQGALAWSASTALNRQKRHVRVRYHYVREEVEAGRFAIKYVPTGECAADGLTKPLPAEGHKQFVKLLNLRSGDLEGEP